tara:strand:- start:4782 stop:5726 length:945 start_codon:yes stop_codon:yes gene_type:complete
MYPFNNRWMDKVTRLHPEGIVNNGLSDHESLFPVPVELIGTLHYLQTARIMKEFAGIMNDLEGQIKYDQLALDLEKKVREAFWEKSIVGPINRQTLFASLLYHKIIPNDQIEAAKDSLKHALQKAPAQHLTTGIFGTPFALEAISKHLSPQTTFDIINSKDYPGWGHMVDRGATTLWETWKESEDIYSNSHPMFGSVTEWFFRWLGGIRPHSNYPGFERFYIKPFTPVGLESASSTYMAPNGKIISNWIKENQGYLFKITVPKTSIAQVVINKKTHQKITILKGKTFFNTTEIADLNDGKFNLKGGEYTFRLSP